MKQDREFFEEATVSNHGVELTRFRAHYPYLLSYAFSRDALTPALENLLHLYANAVMEDVGDDAGRLVKLTGRLIESEFSDAVWPDGAFGIKRIGNWAARSDWNGERSISIGFSKTEWKLQRFGDCLGIRPIGVNRNDSELHEEATRILGRMLNTQIAKGVHLHPFYRLIRMVTRRYQREYDMALELADLRRHIPTVEWTEDVVGMRQKLVEDFIEDHLRMETGVVVGSYHGLLIRAKLLWSKDTAGGDRARRRGTIISGDDSTIQFDGSDSSDFSMAYSVGSSDGDRHLFSSAEIDHAVDYHCQQDVMENAARVLYSGLVELEYANLVRINPWWTKTRK